MTDLDYVKATVQKILNGYKDMNTSLDQLNKTVDEVLVMVEQWKAPQQIESWDDV